MAHNEIPLDAPGIPWDTWYEQQIDRIFAEARDRRNQATVRATPAPESTKYSAIPATTRSGDDERLLAFSPYDER